MPSPSVPTPSLFGFRSRSARQAGALLALLLWVSILIVIARSWLEPALREPPKFASLAVLEGRLSSSGLCGGKGRYYGFLANLVSPTGEVQVRLPCTAQLLRLPAGTQMTIHTQQVTPFLGESYTAVWHVASGPVEHYRYIDRLARERDTRWIAYLLAAVPLLLLLPVAWLVYHAGWKEDNASVQREP